MKRIPLTIFWVLALTLICSAQTTFYYPHVANGVLGANIWKTTIFLTNPAASGTASGTVAFAQDSANLSAAGSVFSGISFVDQDGAPAGSGGTITFSIPGGQTRKYTSSGTGTYAGGFAIVQTTAGTVSGTAIFLSSTWQAGCSRKPEYPPRPPLPTNRSLSIRKADSP